MYPDSKIVDPQLEQFRGKIIQLARPELGNSALAWDVVGEVGLPMPVPEVGVPDTGAAEAEIVLEAVTIDPDTAGTGYTTGELVEASFRNFRPTEAWDAAQGYGEAIDRKLAGLVTGIPAAAVFASEFYGGGLNPTTPTPFQLRVYTALYDDGSQFAVDLQYGVSNPSEVLDALDQLGAKKSGDVVGGISFDVVTTADGAMSVIGARKGVQLGESLSPKGAGAVLEGSLAPDLSLFNVGGEARINIYGTGEAPRFLDVATDIVFAEGRPLTSSLASGSAREILIRNAPATRETIAEIQRLIGPGGRVSIVGPAEGFVSMGTYLWGRNIKGRPGDGTVSGNERTRHH